MLILALDTSGDICSVAVSDDSRERASYHFRHERRLSERLSAIVSFVLRDAGASLRDVETFAVGLGPGSFTGVRVGVTMAKTFAFALNRPVVGISSLDALAEPLARLGAVAPAVAAIAPTRRGEVVAAFYRAGAVQPIAAPAVTPNADVAAHGRLLVGAGVPLLLIGEATGPVVADTPAGIFAAVCTCAPSAAAVMRLAAQRLSRGEADDPDSLVPLYVTPSPVG
jgi:tRNA threonylcarbamoyladenosine biosynthesis protein TsaB